MELTPSIKERIKSVTESSYPIYYHDDPARRIRKDCLMKMEQKYRLRSNMRHYLEGKWVKTEDPVEAEAVLAHAEAQITNNI